MKLHPPLIAHCTSPRCRATLSSPLPAAAAGATVIVVGAGPAGLLAAAFLAARHGAAVHVYDMRSHPGPIPMPPGAEDSNDRAFALAMNSRGTAAVQAAGLDVAALLATPGADLAVVRDQLIGQGDALPRADGSAARSLLTIPADRSRVVGSRQAFVRGLLHLIEQQQQRRRAAGEPGSVRFTFGAAFEGADLAARSATFLMDSGVRSSVRWAVLPPPERRPHMRLPGVACCLPEESPTWGLFHLADEGRPACVLMVLPARHDRQAVPIRLPALVPWVHASRHSRCIRQFPARGPLGLFICLYSPQTQMMHSHGPPPLACPSQQLRPAGGGRRLLEQGAPSSCRAGARAVGDHHPRQPAVQSHTLPAPGAAHVAAAGPRGAAWQLPGLWPAADGEGGACGAGGGGRRRPGHHLLLAAHPGGRHRCGDLAAQALGRSRRHCRACWG